MYSRILEQQGASFEAAQNDASGTRRGPKAAFGVDLRLDFRWPQVEVARKERDDRRRTSEWSEEKIEFWAVATPL